MAATQHTRTRSTRPGNPASRHLQPLNQHGRTPSQPQSHNQTIAHTGSSTSNGADYGPSALSTFLTNLRLLDFDTFDDWPGITSDVFASTTTGVQWQKRRIHCVEWALYYLFELWDPGETANKLKPFFPPHDQLQSRNLRAALLRALEQLKKNNVLGRDALIRKTMLDECRGDRLEEILASFSSAVLKKLVAECSQAAGEHPAVAACLASEDRGYKGEKTDIASLVLAHKVSLRRFLEKKEAEKIQYHDFADLLRIKERGISRRLEALKTREDEREHAITDTARAEMRRAVRNNWTGNETWMTTLLGGDMTAKGVGLLDMPFDLVWKRLQQGRLGELEEDASGLLEQLETRVRVQNERLQRWESFRRRSIAEQSKPSPSKQKVAEKKAKGIDLTFTGHQNLQVGRMDNKSVMTRGQLPLMNDEYSALVQDLDGELARLKCARPRDFKFLGNGARRLQTDGTDEPGNHQDPVSEMSDLDEEITDTRASAHPVSNAHRRTASAIRQPARPKVLHGQGSHHSSSKSSSSVLTRWPSRKDLRDTEIGPYQDRRPQIKSQASGTSASTESRSRSPVRPREEPRPKSPTPEIEPSPSPSPTQDMADQILESLHSTSPSPTKRAKPRHTLSLAERTRLSMARGSSQFMDAEDEPELPLRPAVPNTQATAISDDGSSKTLEDEGPQDLVSRTRKSMMGFEKAKQKAQVERRRSLRRSKLPPRREGSYFPKVEEEADHAVLADELLAEEDMEAVFRSRPKIKASPIPSPTRELEFDYE